MFYVSTPQTPKDYTESLALLLAQPRWKLYIFVILLHAMLIKKTVDDCIVMLKTLPVVQSVNKENQ